jgi:histidine triad (HIT) family protein
LDRCISARCSSHAGQRKAGSAEIHAAACREQLRKIIVGAEIMPHCLFCDIATGAIPANVVYDDDLITAFLDIGPIRPGHTQIIPKQHFETFDALPSDIACRILRAGQQMARGMKALFAVKRVAFLFTGGDIPHAHAHLVPMHHPTDITSRRYITNSTVSFGPLPTPDPYEMSVMAEKLRKQFEQHADK